MTELEVLERLRTNITSVLEEKYGLLITNNSPYVKDFDDVKQALEVLEIIEKHLHIEETSDHINYIDLDSLSECFREEDYRRIRDYLKRKK